MTSRFTEKDQRRQTLTLSTNSSASKARSTACQRTYQSDLRATTPSGKSTLMKFICTNSKARNYLSSWPGNLQLLTCHVYFWNPGSLGRKTQEGLLRILLSQLLSPQPHLCRVVARKHYLFYQLAGPKRVVIRSGQCATYGRALFFLYPSFGRLAPWQSLWTG
jgi:hypothetical protein